MIDAHLYGYRAPLSCFSSWAADIGVAIRYSKYESIAILDTNLMESHVKVYHVVGLHRANLAVDRCHHEYLVYGPIEGPAYHHMAYASLAPGLNSIPGTPTSSRQEYIYQYITSAAQSVYDLVLMPRYDMFCAVIAYIVGHRIKGNRGDIDLFLNVMTGLPTSILAEIKPPNPNVSSKIGLANPATYVSGFPNLDWTIRALVALENHEKVRRSKRSGS
ncbi:hypothetical protein F4821DRAFT_171449 [Hypoxylon rubiginosum]|uniref:Uncharacterized protein n=1 Tax=Hypoxylon rubiginosum TaxID=110542 RepID=A0ACC0CVP4_9PEZI|nr:hypothetical protein F4821DRAFT_171449 [Hypoxylon rubiginosum]